MYSRKHNLIAAITTAKLVPSDLLDRKTFGVPVPEYGLPLVASSIPVDKYRFKTDSVVKKPCIARFHKHIVTKQVRLPTEGYCLQTVGHYKRFLNLLKDQMRVEKRGDVEKLLNDLENSNLRDGDIMRVIACVNGELYSSSYYGVLGLEGIDTSKVQCFEDESLTDFIYQHVESVYGRIDASISQEVRERLGGIRLYSLTSLLNDPFQDSLSELHLGEALAFVNVLARFKLATNDSKVLAVVVQAMESLDAAYKSISSSDETVLEDIPILPSFGIKNASVNKRGDRH